MKIKEEVKKLWKLCFDDTDEFIEMYFRLRYNSETTMVIQNGDRIVSSLQMPYYTMTFEGTEIQTAYISGACTHPDFRGKGVMAQLLADSFSRMVQKNIPLSILIPANAGLFDYYARTGYAPAFFRSKIEEDASGIVIEGNLLFEQVTTFDERVFDYFTRKAHDRANYVQHTATDFEAIMEDLRITGGSVTVAYKGKEGPVGGILFAYPEEEYMYVTECFAENKLIKDNLLHEAARYYNKQKISRFELPDHSAEEKPFGMARIIDAKMILHLYAAKHPEENMVIKLTDEQLPFNDGYYHLNHGVCTFTEKPREAEYTEFTTQQLSAYLFERIRLYMSLMLE